MTDIWTEVTLRSGDLELTCLPGIGGRLWDVAYKGRSLLFQNPDLIGATPDLEALQALPTRSPQFRFPLWGGEKTWIAPDTDWVDQSPYPQLDSGAYEVMSSNEHSVRMRSQICQASGLRIDRRITVSSPDGWTLQHQVRNCGTAARRLGIWSVMMLRQPGQIGLQLDEDTEVISVFGNATGRTRRTGPNAIFDCETPQEFKCGASTSSGRVIACLGDPADRIWLICGTDPGSDSQHFAHGHNFEVFNSGDYPYLEAEWHSPCVQLAPGASSDFTQRFTISTDPLIAMAAAALLPSEQDPVRCMF